jgi:hypothetical protein
MESQLESDDNRLMVCEHMLEGKNGPDMLYIEGGRILIATCLPCADEQNERHSRGVTEPLPGFRPLCPGHAQAANIPVTTKMADGFYERDGGQWVRQPSDDEVQ